MLSSEEILKIVDDIRSSDRIIDIKEHFTQKYPVFAEKYPGLFEMCLRHDFDYRQFRFMLNALKKIETKEIDEFTASGAVGQQLFDKYVKDKVDMSKEKK